MRLKWLWLFLALLFPLAAHAQALPCAAYPNTLTNGTLADANQVMANFNTIRNCVNGLSPLGVPVVGSSSKVAAAVPTAGLTVTVTADSVTVGTALNGTSYTLTSYSQSFNGGTNGAGGMDVGALPTSGWVALYAIYNPTAPATSILGTTCATACPTIYAGGNMPAGYTASALLTVLPTNATPALTAATYVRGKNIWTATVQVLSTATAHATPTSISLTSAVPPPAVSAFGLLVATCGTTPGSANIATTVLSDSSTSTPFTINFNCASINSAFFQGNFPSMVLSTAQTLFYTNVVAGTSPSSQIFVEGYTIP